MAEGHSRFPEFERLLEKKLPSVYHEESFLGFFSAIGILISIIGVFVLLFGQDIHSWVSALGLLIFFFGFLVLIVSILRGLSDRRKYRFQGLSRFLISDAIMYIDSQIVPSGVFESTDSGHDSTAFSNSWLVSKREKFIIFMKATAGLISWPSEIVEPIEHDIKNNQERLPVFITAIIAIFIVLVLPNYFLLMSEVFMLVIIGLFLLICCTIQWPFAAGYIVFRNWFFFRGGWILDVRRSDSIQLEESLTEILSLLQSQFPYPLRFFFIKEYPLLTYTGRIETADVGVRLREAVLYPSDTAIGTTC